MKSSKLVSSSILFAFISVGLMGCQDHTAENAGEKIDSTLNKAGNQIEDTCENIKEGLEVKDSNC